MVKWVILLILGIPVVMAIVIKILCSLDCQNCGKSYSNETDLDIVPAAEDMRNNFNMSLKEQKKAWKAIAAKIKYESSKGKGTCIINSTIYRHIPLKTLKSTLKSKGYILEKNIDTYYAKGLLLEISWEEPIPEEKSYEHF